MAETRKAYRVVTGEPPTLEEYTIVITPKRITLHDKHVNAYYDPNRFWLRYKGTPVDAWLQFLDEQRQERNALEEQLAFAQSQIKAGEAYFDSISPLKE